jgi:hypothetical protein
VLGSNRIKVVINNGLIITCHYCTHLHRNSHTSLHIRAYHYIRFKTCTPLPFADPTLANSRGRHLVPSWQATPVQGPMATNPSCTQRASPALLIIILLLAIFIPESPHYHHIPILSQLHSCTPRTSLEAALTLCLSSSDTSSYLPRTASLLPPQIHPLIIITS